VLTVELGGFCAFKGFLNGLTFKVKGVTASGAPYLKAIGDDQYMYYDEDCDGSGEGTARWIIDSDLPNVSRTRDLDQDGACNYHARIDSNNTKEPPTDGDWIMFCGQGWQTQKVSSLSPEHPTDTTHAAPAQLTNFALSGSFCTGKEIFQGLEFDQKGITKSGAGFFKSREHEVYMYYDPSCSGASDGKARWVVDDDEPNTQRASDLDADSACDYHARVDSDDKSSPPQAAFWRVHCDGMWQDVWVALNSVPPPLITEVPTTTDAPRQPGPAFTTTAKESHGTNQDDQGVVDRAHGRAWHLATPLLSILVFALARENLQ